MLQGRNERGRDKGIGHKQQQQQQNLAQELIYLNTCIYIFLKCIQYWSMQLPAIDLANPNPPPLPSPLTGPF